ncbi:MAG: acyltransferase family protein [Nocardioidaceae bacterium]
MTVSASGSTRGPVPARTGTAAEGWAAPRHHYLDNLKVIVIAAIIAIHGVLGYAGTTEAWSYTSVREVTLSVVTEGLLVIVIGPFGMFVIALLFLVAGMLTLPSYERHGPSAYVSSRLLRLGVPFAAFVLLIQPTVIYALEHPLGESPGSYLAEYLGEERQLDSGPLWFVGVLLIFSLGYAGWRALRGDGVQPAGETAAGGRLAGMQVRPISMRHLWVIVAVVAPMSFALRLVWAYGSDSWFFDLNFWQWPVCLAMFGLGIAASRQEWLERTPADLHRSCRTVTVVAGAAMAVLLFTAGALDIVEDAMGGWGLPALAFAVVEPTLSVFGSVWLLGVAQRRLDWPMRWGPALSRSAYGAFILQGIFLIGIALALREVSLPAEVKALLVATGGVAASFGTAWLLATRVRWLGRVL